MQYPNSPSLPDEQWRPAVGFEGVYEVSDQGRVRRVGPGKAARVGRLRKPSPNEKGYLSVVLSVRNRQVRRYVHILVARAFLGPVPPGQEVNHRNGDKSNCRLENLEYLTRGDNHKHAIRTGLRQPRWKLSAEQLEVIRQGHAQGRSFSEMGRELGVQHHTVALAVKRRLGLPDLRPAQRHAIMQRVGGTRHRRLESPELRAAVPELPL